MIIVFPMLVSRAVSENSIPGIAKTIENFIMVNMQDSIINNADIQKQAKSQGIFSRLLIAGGKLIMKEDEDLLEALPPGAEETDHKKSKKEKQKFKNMPPGAEETDHKKSKPSSGGGETELEKRKRERDEEEARRDAIEKRYRDQAAQAREEKKYKDELEAKAARKASTKVNVSDMKSITLDPTYMSIEHTDRYGNKSTSFIGVKVVPLRVKSDVKLSHLLLYDTQVNSIIASSLSLGRSIMRGIYKFLDKWTSRFRVGGLTPSGDPRRDILMGRTGFGEGSETFIVLSKQEDVDEFFLDNIQKINRLYKMGWGNFVVADDISRVAYFCMERFSGLCNVVPYSMMYQYLGQSKAYESLEDAKKANSSIFKISKRFSKIIGECKADQKFQKYSQLNEDIYNE